jgi:hypothetical protein
MQDRLIVQSIGKDGWGERRGRLHRVVSVSGLIVPLGHTAATIKSDADIRLEPELQVAGHRQRLRGQSQGRYDADREGEEMPEKGWMNHNAGGF